MLLHTLGFVVSAWASGGTAPVAPPVDVASLPASAVVRPPGANGDPHPVEVRLLVEPGVVAPGGQVALGIHLAQDEGWHTYWRTPGDIGLPTQITWTLPEGATVGARHWPVPERFDAEGIVSYGYDHEVLHVTDVVVPAGLAPGEHRIAADVEWLVCKASCIPGKAHVERTITVGEAQPGPHAEVFAHWVTRRAVADPALRAEAIVCVDAARAEKAFRTVVALKAAEGASLAAVPEARWPQVVPILGSDHGLDRARVLPWEGGVLVGLDATAYAMPANPAADLAGALVQVDVTDASGTRTARTEVTAQVPWATEGVPVPSTDPRCTAFDAEAPVVAALADELAEPAEATHNEAGAAAVGVGLILWNLFLAFVGGLILNVMPCVLPVLTLKLYGLVEQAGITQGERRQAGLLYTLGILASFWALALAVYLARELMGSSVGWGFQFQYPGYVAVLATMVFLFGLSLFGVFEVPAFGTGQAHDLSTREGPGGYFFTGVFATLVATPCSAPFLGTATAFAFQAPTAQLVLIFSAVGLGLAFPFLVVAYVPAAYRLLPRPGAWMETFKQLLGFSLLATTVWLVGVLGSQIGEQRLTGFLGFLVVVGLAAWVQGRFGGVAEAPQRQLGALAVGSALMALGVWAFVDLEFASSETCDDAEIALTPSYAEHVPWQTFQEDRLKDLVGHTVFVDFTAEWCVSCKVNERTVLETAQVREVMDRLDVVALKADWTRQDPVIGAWLKRYDRGGVPLYLVIPPSGVAQAVALPEVITPGMVVSALEGAAGR